MQAITIDRSSLARELLAAFLEQVLQLGIFNADPHPGNVLILADGTLGQIDFGSAGRLHAAQRLAPARLLLASTARMRSYCSIAWPNAAAR